MTKRRPIMGGDYRRERRATVTMQPLISLPIRIGDRLRKALLAADGRRAKQMSGKGAGSKDRGLAALDHTAKAVANHRNGEILAATVCKGSSPDEAAILISLAHQPDARTDRRAAVRADNCPRALSF